eukprot:m.70311 g.70311  ORF g.70311 m.70311 type:complete len:807 (-) comp12122_c0_seq2:14-2434(-)
MISKKGFARWGRIVFLLFTGSFFTGLLCLLCYQPSGCTDSSIQLRDEIPPAPRGGVRRDSDRSTTLEGLANPPKSLNSPGISNASLNVKTTGTTKQTPSKAEELIKASWPTADIKKLQKIYQNVYWHSLNTATIQLSDNFTFVYTGDIKEMWLRDSAAQMHPMTLIVNEFTDLYPVLIGVARQQAVFLLGDPYGSAFSAHPYMGDKHGGHKKKIPVAKETHNHDLHKIPDYDIHAYKPGKFTAQAAYELDSPMYFFRLLHTLHKASRARVPVIVKNKDHGPSDIFVKNLFQDERIKRAISLVIKLIEFEMNHMQQSGYKHPKMKKGTVKDGINLTWSAFRPSDDLCKYGYHIPGNLFAAVALKWVSDLALEYWGDTEISAKALALSSGIREAVLKYGTKSMQGYGEIYCYEIDGLGNCNTMDDANVPSLLGIPYIDDDAYAYDKEIYERTRKWVLSHNNPQYFEGAVLRGIGSPHTTHGMVWPMSIAIQALTTDTVEEKVKLLHMLVQSDDDSSFMHEAVDPNHPDKYTRPWFEWSNALFIELTRSLCPTITTIPLLTFQSDPFQFCSFSGQFCQSESVEKKVCARFGARIDGGIWTYKILNPRFNCVSSEFGFNPTPGIPKHCWVAPLSECKGIIHLQMRQPHRESGGSQRNKPHRTRPVRHSNVHRPQQKPHLPHPQHQKQLVQSQLQKRQALLHERQHQQLPAQKQEQKQQREEFLRRLRQMEERDKKLLEKQDRYYGENEEKVKREIASANTNVAKANANADHKNRVLPRASVNNNQKKKVRAEEDDDYEKKDEKAEEDYYA